MTEPASNANMQDDLDGPPVDVDDEVAEPSPSPTGTPITRERSTIKFPYHDLDDVVNVAQVLHEKRGGHARLSELAAALGQVATSGSFRLRISAARMFGLLNLQNKEVTLTPLGKAVIDPGPSATLARVNAFLAVPLYKAIYDEFSDSRLPDDVGLEARMHALGVTPNQTSRARQLFARSAEQAGFFETAGRNRLVKPPVGHVDAPRHDEAADEPRHDEVTPPPAREPVDETDPLADPMLKGLLQKLLPPVGTPFRAAARRQLFTALAVNLDVVYGPAPDGHIDYQEVGKLVAQDRPSGDSS